MIVERDGKFEVQSEDGKTLGIHATHRGALNQLHAIEWSKAQRMANGGSPVLSLDDVAQPQSIPETTIPLAIEPGSTVATPQAEPPPRVWPSERERLAGITDAELAARGDLPVGAGGSPEEIARNQAYTQWAQTGVGPRPPPVAPVGSPAAQKGEHPWSMPAAQESLARGAAAQPHAPAQVSAAGAQAPQGGLEGAFERGSESPGERAQREMEQDVEQKGQIQQANYLAQQSELQRQEAERQQAQRDFLAAQKDNERLHQEWAAKVPDQNRWWNSKSTGNKIGSAIAMIVGGFASGAVGQKNQALGVIEDSIAKDVQAQADQKNSMVSFYLQRGKDLKEAYALTASNLMMSAASRMEQLKASMGAQMVGPDTDLAIKGLRAQAAQLQQAATLKGAEFLKMKAETRKIDSETYKNYAEASKVGRESWTPEIGRTYTLAEVNQMPDKFQQEMAQVGPGKFLRVTGGSDEVKKFKSTLENADIMGGATTRLESAIKKGDAKFDLKDRAYVSGLAAGLMGPLRAQLGLGVLSEGDKKLLEGIIADPSEIFKFDSTQLGKIKALTVQMSSAIDAAKRRAGMNVPVTTDVD